MRKFFAVSLVGVLLAGLVIGASTVAIGMDGSDVQHIALHEEELPGIEEEQEPDIEPTDIEPLDDDVLPGDVIPEEFLDDLTPQSEVPTPDEVGVSEIDHDEQRITAGQAPEVWTGYFPNGTKTEFEQDPAHFEDAAVPGPFKPRE